MHVPDPAILLQKYQDNLSSLSRLDNEACIKAYSSSIISTRSDVLLISTYRNSSDSLIVSNRRVPSPALPDGSLSTQWMYQLPTSYGAQECDYDPPAPDPRNWSIGVGYKIGAHRQNSEGFPVGQATIEYCLSQPVEEQRQIQFSLGIVVTILACNFVKVICMGIIVWNKTRSLL